MFCSLCKSVEKEIRECRRKICQAGHVICERCDDSSQNCQECQMEISSFICVQVVDRVPRLFIEMLVHIEPSSLAQEEDAQNSSGGSDSLKQIIEDLNEYEDNQSTGDQHGAERPTIGCFEVVASHPKSSVSISLDGEEERDILQCFEACGKLAGKDKADAATGTTKKSSKNSLKRSAIPRNIKTVHQEETQTVTYVVTSSSRSRTEANYSICPTVPSSRNLQWSTSGYANDERSNESDYSVTDANSVFELFRSRRVVEDSEPAHFTPTTISSAPSPPDSPGKNGIPSVGCRVKYNPVFSGDCAARAQMEPLAIYEVESSGSEDELSRDLSSKLPRFPVRCPITYCESCNVPSDFCNHITIDHPYVDVQKVKPNQVINMRVNHKANINMMACQRLFLLTGKIGNIGYGAFENCLPIVLMTSRLSLRKAFGSSSSASRACDENFCALLVGVYQFPVDYTLTLWTHGHDIHEPTIIKSISTSARYMNKPVGLKKIAGHALTVSRSELQKLTDNGRKMLSCQIVFH